MALGRTNLSSLACLSLCASISAQGRPQAGPQAIPVSTRGEATLTLATGELVRGPRTTKSVALASAFVNTDTSGFFGTGMVASTATGNPIEWLDWGIVTSYPGDTSIVGAFTFGYGTFLTDTTLGGPGAQATLRFYDGITGFCDDSGAVPTASFSFTGLPGASLGSDASWIVTVDLVGGFEFCTAGPGNAFGFGFTTTDDADGDLMRDTGPLLCYAGEVSGPPPPGGWPEPDCNGQVDVFDEWDVSPQSDLCLGSFFFGGTPFNFSSWYLVIDTGDSTGTSPGSSTFRNGGTNPGDYLVLSPPVLGGTFTAVDVQSSGGLGVFVVGYATPADLATPYGQLLVDVTDPGGDLLAGSNGPYPFAGNFASIQIPVPKNLNLSGLTLSTQTLEFGGSGLQLHNAQDLVVGCT